MWLIQTLWRCTTDSTAWFWCFILFHGYKTMCLLKSCVHTDLLWLWKQSTQICIEDIAKVFSHGASFPPNNLTFSRSLFYEITNAKGWILYVFQFYSNCQPVTFHLGHFYCRKSVACFTYKVSVSPWSVYGRGDLDRLDPVGSTAGGEDSCHKVGSSVSLPLVFRKGGGQLQYNLL